MRAFVAISLGIAGCALLGGFAGPATAEHDRLNVVSWGGAYTAAQMQAFVEPYRESVDAGVEVDRYDGGLEEVEAQVRARNVEWDVIDLGLANAVRGCAQGLFEKLDHGGLPAGPDGTAPDKDFREGMLPACAVGQNVFSNVIAYDTGRFAGGGAPDSAEAFFDTRRYPGERGLRANPRGTLELALLADGVAADEVYEVLSTEEGLQRAFDKLATIADEIVWWTGAEEPQRLLAKDAVAMTTAYNGRVQTAIDARGAEAAIIWDNQILDYELWAVVKGTPLKQASLDFIRFASTAERQAELARHIAYGPARKSAMALLDDDVKAKLPTAEAHMRSALRTDHEWWAAHQSEMDRRFQRFVRGTRTGAGAPGKGGTL